MMIDINEQQIAEALGTSIAKAVTQGVSDYTMRTQIEAGVMDALIESGLVASVLAVVRPAVVDAGKRIADDAAARISSLIITQALSLVDAAFASIEVSLEVGGQYITEARRIEMLAQKRAHYGALRTKGEL